MLDQHFLSTSAAGDDISGPLRDGEREVWRGQCGLAEYAFDQAASMPLWTLPESAEVLVTDRRVLFSYAPVGRRARSGAVRWLWPQHLRVQPGTASADRGVAATQIQLVCGGADGAHPALVLAGGVLGSVAAVDRLANLLRQTIARYRVDNAGSLGLTAQQSWLLSRLLIAPEFRNHQGGPGQTVSLPGALPVSRPAVRAGLPGPETTRLITYRPGQAAGDDEPTFNLSARAEVMRRTAARLAANSARWRARRTVDREPGETTRSNRIR